MSVPSVYSGFIHGFLFDDAFDKGLTFKMGQTHVHRFLPELLDQIETGRLSPEVIISHRMSLEQAAEGYKYLHKAHSLTMILFSGERLNGTVAHARRLENADLELQIDV